MIIEKSTILAFRGSVLSIQLSETMLRNFLQPTYNIMHWHMSSFAMKSRLFVRNLSGNVRHIALM